MQSRTGGLVAASCAEPSGWLGGQEEKLTPKAAAGFFFRNFLRLAARNPPKEAVAAHGVRETAKRLCSTDGSDQVLIREDSNAASLLAFTRQDAPKNGLLVLNGEAESFDALRQSIANGARYTLKVVAFAKEVPFARKPFLWWKKSGEYRTLCNKLNSLCMDDVSQGMCTGSPTMRLMSGGARLQHGDYWLYVVATDPARKGSGALACDLSLILVAKQEDCEALSSHAGTTQKMAHWLEEKFAHMEAAARRAAPHFERYGIAFEYQAVATKHP